MIFFLVSTLLRLDSNLSLPPANEVWGNVIFSEACVKNSVHRGACMVFWGACMVAGGHVWLGGVCGCQRRGVWLHRGACMVVEGHA